MGCFSSSGSEQKSQSTSQAQSHTGYQEDVLNSLLKQYYKNRQNDNVFQGDRVADFTPLQNKSVSGASNFVDTFSKPQTAGTPLFDETGDALSGLLAGKGGAQKITQDQADTYFNTSVVNPTLKTLKQDILPGVDEGYAGGDFFNSARGKARQKAATDVSDTLTSQRAGFNWDVLQSNQALDESAAARTQTAVNQGMTYSQMPAEATINNLRIAASQVAGLGDLFGIGSAQQTQQQKEIEAKIAKFAEDNQITDPQSLSVLMSLLGLSYSTSTSNSYGSGSSNGNSLGYLFAGSAAKGLGEGAAAALLASDINVKENIEPITVLDKIAQLKPYRYNYKGDPTPRIGLIAQDIEKVFPEAVVTIDGIKHVDTYALQAIIIGAIAEMRGA